MSISDAIPLLIVSSFILYLTLWQRSKYAQLPPGPPGHPIIGNVLQLTEKNVWFKFTKWKEEYGPIIHLYLAGRHLIVLGSAEVAADLLDRRSGIYSGRPTSIVIEVLTRGLIFAFSQYNEKWRRVRKAVHKALNHDVVKKYRPFQISESVLLLSQLLQTPTEFNIHLKRASNSLFLSLLYGQPPISSSKDPKIEKVNTFTKHLENAGSPGTFLVEFFNWMRFLPRCMSKWRRDAEDWFIKDSEMIEGFMTDVRNRMAEGTQKACFMSSLLEGSREFSDVENAWTAMTLYAAASDATAGQMAWFILAMVLHPDVQKRAQEELDRVVGRDRLPGFEDHEKLHYIKALIKECLRWRPVTVIGIPHKLDQDDWYNGYFIPRDTICIANIWEMNHDKNIFGPDAEEFRPERHLDLKSGVFLPDEWNVVTFGFGRRICVGQYVANDTMFIMIASILWAFNISPGDDVIPDPMDIVDDGLATHPTPFKCRIVPRFEEVAHIVEYNMEISDLQR